MEKDKKIENDIKKIKKSEDDIKINKKPKSNTKKNYIPSFFRQPHINDDKMFYLNTNSIFDVATGSYLPGINENSFCLNGGLAPLTAVIGGEQTYKSSIAGSFLSRVLKIYKDSYGIYYDSEYAIPNEERVISMSDEIDGHEIGNRLVLKDKNNYDMDGIFNLLRELSLERETHKKDLLVETPFLNPKTNKSYLMMVPCIVLIDSLSLMQSVKELDMYNEHDISSKEQNMLSMNDGKLKSQFVKQLPLLSHKGSIHIILTAHITNKVQLSMFDKSKKDLQFMKHNDTTRGTGKQFRALVNTLLETRSLKVLQDSNKGPKYPFGNSSNVELSEIDAVMCRNKNNESGGIVPLISSQKFGIQADLGYYHYLTHKLNTNSGLDYNSRNSRSLLKPDVTMMRTNVREKLNNDYELARSIEILGQICYIKNWWNIRYTPEFQNLNELTMEDLCTKLIENKKLPISEILNSRGYWTYDKTDKRKYLSIIDIISLAT